MAGESKELVARRQRAKAERLTESSERSAKGADGARATAAVLDELPSEWRVLHDVPWPGRPRANIDHIVIGPAGIFVVDSKNWSGAISVRGDVLRQGKYSREGAVASVEEAARAVARLLRVSTGKVKPVICLVREDKIVATTRGVTVCSTGSIVRLLTSRQRTLSEFHIRVLAIELEPHRVRHAGGGGRRRRSRSRRSAGQKGRAARHGSGGVVVGALAALTVAVTLAVSPHVVTDLVERVTGLLVDLTGPGEGAERPDEPAPERPGIQAEERDVRPGRTQTRN